MKKRNAILMGSAAVILSVFAMSIVFSKLKTNHNSVSAENFQQNHDNSAEKQKEIVDTPPAAQEDANKERSGFAEIFLQNGENLTSEQIEILENMPELEKKYLEAGLNAPVDPNF